MVPFTGKDKAAICVEAVAILIGDYPVLQKKAALLLAKAFLPSKVVESILYEYNTFPFDRNDPRVREWTKQVLKRGKCEECGSTEDLEAHHIIKWADYPQGRVDLKNGQCLCHNCHTNEHINDTVYFMMKAKSRKK